MDALSVDACIGAMKMLVSGAYCEHLERLGIHRDILRQVRSYEPFEEIRQQTVIDTINAVVQGTLQVQRLPKIEISAEMISCAIFVTIRSINVPMTCYWMQGYYKAEDLARDPEMRKKHELITGGQLLAMVQFLYADGEMKIMKERFENIIDRRLQEQLEVNAEPEKSEVTHG